VNGRRVPLGAAVDAGYARIRRRWRPGDRVDLDLPMPVERIEANPHVRQDCGCVALQRGPLVFCLEEEDNGPDLADLALPRRAPVEARFDPGLLGGAVVVEGRARRRGASGWDGVLYRPAGSRTREVPLRAIPYFLWANRGPGEMRVWVRES
jgi:hypothetical protein